MFQFGEASRLYAENLPVVREMEKAFTEDLERFFRQLSEAVVIGAEPLTVTSLPNGKSWYWWSGPTEWEQERPKVWCTWSDPEIITESRLSLYVGSATLDGPAQERVRALAASLAMWTCPKKSSKWQALHADAKWTSTESSVEVVASPIIAALRALDEHADVIRTTTL